MIGESFLAPSDNTERWNYRVLLAQGVCSEIAQNLASAQLVLPFLFLAVGAPVLYAGLLIPLVQLSRMLGQILSAPLIHSATVRKWYMGSGLAAVAFALTIVGLAANLVSIEIITVLFLAVAALIGLGQALTHLAFQHMLGHLLPQQHRTALLFSQSALSGVLAIAIAWLLSLAYEDGESFESHVALLWAGVACYLLAAIYCFALRETTAPLAAEASKSFLGEITKGLVRALGVSWFRRLLAARFLFLSVELATPFYAIHAASLHKEGAGTLSLFVIAASAGLIVGGPLWQRMAGRSLRWVMSVGAAMAAVAGGLAITIDVVPLFRHEVYYAVVFLLVSLADQGITASSKIYLVESAPERERAYFIAASDAITGACAVAFAFALGALAHLQHVVWPLYALVALNLGALVTVAFLPELPSKPGSGKRAPQEHNRASS